MDLAIQVAIIAFFLSGALLFWKSVIYRSSYHSKDRLSKYKAAIVRGLQNGETDRLVKYLGFSSGLLYQLIRYSILIALLAYLAYKKYLYGDDVILPVILGIVLFFISSPRRYLFNKDSPFFILISQFEKIKKQKLNREIYRCLSQMKNIAIAKSNTKYSADFLICELAKYTTYAKPIFDRMLGYWYEGRFNEATDYFEQAIGTKEAKALASLLAKLDYIKPSEFVSQIELYQNEAKEERKTAAQKSRENKSNLVYGLVMAAGILIIVNLIVITIGIDYKFNRFFIF